MPNSTDTLPNLITPEELRKLLRISKTGVYRLVEKRVIPFYRVRGALRFDKQDVLEFLRKGRVGPFG